MSEWDFLVKVRGSNFKLVLREGFVISQSANEY